MVPPTGSKDDPGVRLEAIGDVMGWVSLYDRPFVGENRLSVIRADRGEGGPVVLRLPPRAPLPAAALRCMRVDGTIADILARPDEYAVVAESSVFPNGAGRGQLGRGERGRTGGLDGWWADGRRLQASSAATAARLCVELATTGSALPTAARIVRDVGAGAPPGVIGDHMAAGLRWRALGPNSVTSTSGCIAMSPPDGRPYLDGATELRIEVTASPVGGGPASTASIPLVIDPGRTNW